VLRGRHDGDRPVAQVGPDGVHVEAVAQHAAVLDAGCDRRPILGGRRAAAEDARQQDERQALQRRPPAGPTGTVACPVGFPRFHLPEPAGSLAVSGPPTVEASRMKSVLVLYMSRGGHTARIARRICEGVTEAVAAPR